MKYLLSLACMFLFMLPGLLLTAQPDFTSSFDESGTRLYKDIKQPQLFYYVPGKITLGATSSGKPDLNFLMMRYTGTAVYNDQEQKVSHRNILTMRMVMQSPQPASLQLAKTRLEKRFGTCELRPLPISQLQAMIVFTPVGVKQDSISVVQKGVLSAEGNNGYSNAGEYWQERYFTIFPDDQSANLLFDALSSERTVISFMYAFYSKGISDKRTLEASGYGGLADMLQKQLDVTASEDTSAIKECLVTADAFTIRINSTWFPQLVKKIDINDAVPPGYAILNVRNYDFINHLREDLYEKTLELEAFGAGGDKVQLSTVFNIRNPDVSSVNFRFKYAVRLDKPYHYRVRELYKDGREVLSDWITVTEWSPLLDITTKQL